MLNYNVLPIFDDFQRTLPMRYSNGIHSFFANERWLAFMKELDSILCLGVIIISSVLLKIFSIIQLFRAP